MHAKTLSRVRLAGFSFLMLILALNRVGSGQTLANKSATEDTSLFLSTAQLEEEYAKARGAIQAQDWVQALVALEMVLAANPNYRDANALLVTARHSLERDSTEARRARMYVEGMKAKRAGEFERAREELRTLVREQKNYRDAAKQLAVLEQQLQTKPAPSASPAEIVVEVPVDSLLFRARQAVAQQDWNNAAAFYEKLETLDPANLKLRQEAEQARVQLLIAQTGLARVEAHGAALPWLELTILVCCLLLFVLLLFLAFSLRMRVRYYLRREEFRRAAQVYENALQRKPQHFKLYPPLAEIYLRDNRTDAAAMKIFKTILDLNLPTKEREAITTLVHNQAKPGMPSNTETVHALEAAVRNARDQAERSSASPAA